MTDILPLRRPTDAATTVSEPDSLAVDAKTLAEMLDCGLRTVRTWDAAGKIPAPLRIGGRVLWRVTEIRAWLDAGAPDRKTWAAMNAVAKNHR